MSTAQPAPAEVFDRVADSYDQLGIPYFSVFGRRLVEVAGVRTGEQVLDVGAGRGAVTLPAADAVGPSGHVTAIDLAPSMVDRLRGDVAVSGHGHVDVTQMDAQAPDLPVGSFDVLLAGLMLFFLPDPPAALGHYRRLLRPGGRLGVSTFGPDDERWRWVDDLRRFSSVDNPFLSPRRELFGSTERVEDLVRGAGFTDVSSTVDTHEVRFPDVDTWWRWSWSHGGRRCWDTVPSERVDEARRWCEEQFATVADADGSAGMKQPIRYTTARRG